MNEALVENAQHDVDGDQRGQNQQGFVGERVLEGCRGSLKIRLQAGREIQLFRHIVDVVDGRAQRGVGREVERNGDGRELPLVIDGESFGGGRSACVKALSGTALAPVAWWSCWA